MEDFKVPAGLLTITKKRKLLGGNRWKKRVFQKEIAWQDFNDMTRG